MVLNLFVLAAYYSGKKKFDGTHEGKKDQKNENSTFLILSRIFLELAAHLKKSTAHWLRNTALMVQIS